MSSFAGMNILELDDLAVEVDLMLLRVCVGTVLEGAQQKKSFQFQ